METWTVHWTLLLLDWLRVNNRVSMGTMEYSKKKYLGSYTVLKPACPNMT